MAQWIELTGFDGCQLACLDFGGDGRTVLMLHGLAGHSREWAEAVAALGAGFRCVAFDQRGHGRSIRRPTDLSRQAFVADVAAVLEQLSLVPAVLIGQSMGGNTSYLTAAAHPELVDALVVVEASPDGPIPELAEHIRRWLDGWPVPFTDEADASEFFESVGLSPAAWTEGLERRDGALWPSFDEDVMVECIRELAARSYWEQWRSIRCATLLMRGDRGHFDQAHYDELAGLLPSARTATIPDAGHDVHLDAPAQLADSVRRFLEQPQL